MTATERDQPTTWAVTLHVQVDTADELHAYLMDCIAQLSEGRVTVQTIDRVAS